MLSLVCLCLLLSSCISLDIGEAINDNCSDDCLIELDASFDHNISQIINQNTTNITNSSITITTNSSAATPARIVVNTALVLTNFASTITFNNVIIDGFQNEESNFLQINTNQPAQINILNSKLINFNTLIGAIYIVENIKSFTVKSNIHNIEVDVLDISNSNSFITINLINSTFADNTNHDSNGGVLSLVGHEFHVNIENCQFSNNSVTAWRKNGGCISWDRSSTPDPLQDDIDNAAQDVGGPIYNNYDFENNTETTWRIHSFMNITNSTFSNCSASDAGGVFYVIQTKAFEAANFTLVKVTQTVINGTNSSNSTVIENVATATIFILRDFELNSEQNVFTDNTAGQYGGAYRHSGYTEKQEDAFSDITLLCEDSRYRITMIEDRYINNGIVESGDDETFTYGGALSSTCAQVTVVASTFVDNVAIYGSALSIYASSSVSIDGCQFRGNNGSFGTVYINGLLKDSDSGYYATVSNSQFMDNRADNDGAGVLAIIINELIIDTCVFSDNWNRFYGSVSVQYFATYSPMFVQIINSQFNNNIVRSDDVVAGGAITAQRYDYNQGGYDLNCYDEDTASFYDDIEGLSLFITLCDFISNTQSAIGLSVVSAYISHSSFVGNTNSLSHGGALQSFYSWFKVSGCNFTHNTALQSGGAISSGISAYTNVYPEWVFAYGRDGQECDIKISGCHFDSNVAGDGEGLGGAVFIGTNSSITDNFFVNNAAGYGGAVGVNAYFMTVHDNIFINNTAQTHGGGVFQTQYSNYDIDESGGTVMVLQIKSNVFRRCYAEIGGGVFLRTVRNEKIEITDNEFESCVAYDVGGGLVIGQLLPLDYDYLLADGAINDSNTFTDNSGKREFNDFVSNPFLLYINSETPPIYGVSPGISYTAALGAFDVFDQDFLSFMITDWRDKENNFEFFLNYEDYPPFELLTVNSGSLSSGQANISFVVGEGDDSDVVVTYLGSNNVDLIPVHQQSWQLVECPSGYGYNTHNKTCNLCESDTFKVEDGWTQCMPCLEGLSCRGGKNVQILHKNWWSAEFASSKETFFCRLGECCTKPDGCVPDSDARCPSDRDASSIGCGNCTVGLSARHGSHKCGDCTGHDGMNGAAIAGFVVWPIVLVFLFGLAKYDGDAGEEGNICSEFYSVSLIEIAVLVLIDYYQSLPAILTFEPDGGTYFLINLFFARIPITQNGICLFDEMTILQQTYWDLLVPSLILTISFIIFALSHWYGSKMYNTGNEPLNIFKLRWKNGWFAGWVYDPLRCVMFAMFFCIIPMLWSCSKLFKCIEYGDYVIFWNAPGQECNDSVVVGMAFIFVALTAVYVVGNMYYSTAHLIHHEDIENNKKLIPLYLQRMQPFYFMISPFDDKNSRRHSKISADQKLTWQNIEFRRQRHFKYLYIGWISPFLRKITCLLIFNCVTGAKGQSDQTFVVTNLVLATLVLYQLFSQDYTSMANYTLHLYCMYLLYWLVLLIVSGSTKIITENSDTMQSLKIIVNVIMWIPVVCVAFVVCWAILLLVNPDFLERAKPVVTVTELDYEKAKTLNRNFTSARSINITSDSALQKSSYSGDEVDVSKEQDDLL